MGEKVLNFHTWVSTDMKGCGFACVYKLVFISEGFDTCNCEWSLTPNIILRIMLRQWSDNALEKLSADCLALVWWLISSDISYKC